MRCTSIIMMLLSGFSTLLAESISKPFNAPDWTLVNAEVLEHAGKTALMGTAILKDVAFENGIIEVEMFVSGERSYPGVIFRAENLQNYERFYIRPHRNGLYGDDIQYTPSTNGIDSWQLYNGEGCTAAKVIPENRWVHYKLEVSGTQARIYIDHETEPVLVITDLKHGISKGMIGVYGPKDRTAYFADFRYQTQPEPVFDTPADRVLPYGMITRWELSQPFRLSQTDMEKYPADQAIQSIQWHKIEADHSGLVDIARFTGRISGAGDCILARTTISSGKERLMNLKFGYSDAVSIFLNGRIVFFGNSGYRQRDPSFLGIIGLHDAVYLPLEKGENELLLIVAESFGGWGFMCQDGDAEYLNGRLTPLWEKRNELQFPESVVYDQKRDLLYVSSYYNDGHEFISRLKTDGSIETLQWIAGLSRPTGMCMFNDRLYAVDRTSLVEIDPDSGKIVSKNPVPGAVFLNDCTVDKKGTFYISDNERNVIFRLMDGQVDVWLESEDILKPNGLYADNNRLLVGTSGDGCLKAISLTDKSIKTLACIGHGSIMDGIKIDSDKNILISDYNGRVFLIRPDGSKELILNRTAAQRSCADFEYIAENNLLIIPSLFDNRISAFRLSR